MNFPFEEKLLDNFNELNDYTDYQQFPELIERFDFFWQELTEKQKIYQNSEYIRRMSLLTAIKLVDFEQLTPKLKIYIFSDISDLHKNYLRARLKTTLTTYALTFVENYKEAQLIISTIEFLEELNESQRLLQVCSNFSLIDMSIVERAAQKITSTAIDG
jgi:hypothetical protein